MSGPPPARGFAPVLRVPPVTVPWPGLPLAAAPLAAAPLAAAPLAAAPRPRLRGRATRGRPACRRNPEHGLESRDGSVGAIPGQVAGPGFTATVRAWGEAQPAAWYRFARDGQLLVTGGVGRTVTGGVRATGNVRVAAPGQRGRTCGLLPVRARGQLLRQWRRRKRRDVGFRGGRDVFAEGPAAEERCIFFEGLSGVFRGVFRLSRARLRSRLDGFWCYRMAVRPHVRPATAAKLIPRGNGMPVIASPHRSPLSVPAGHHPPC